MLRGPVFRLFHILRESAVRHCCTRYFLNSSQKLKQLNNNDNKNDGSGRDTRMPQKAKK